MNMRQEAEFDIIRNVLCIVIVCVMFGIFSENAAQAKTAAKWNKGTVTVTKGIYTFKAHLSKNKKNAWIYNITSSKKNKANALVFPKKIKGAKLTRIMSDESTYDDNEFYQNIFGEWVEPAHNVDGSNAVCRKIKKISIPDTVEDIGSCSLGGLNSVESITLPKSLKRLGGCAFMGTNALKSITVPAGFEGDISNGFTGNKKLESITIHEQNKVYSSEKGVLYNKDKTKVLWIPPVLKEVRIAETVTEIGDFAFYFSQADYIYIPASVKKISYNAFWASKCRPVIELDANNPVYKQDGNTIYKDSDKSLLLVVADNKGQVTISERVTFIKSSSRIVGDFHIVHIPASIEKVTYYWTEMCDHFYYYEDEDDEDEDDYDEEDRVYIHVKTPPIVVNKKGVPYPKKDIYDEEICGYAELYVPKESLKAYKKWSSGAEFKAYMDDTAEKKDII